MFRKFLDPLWFEELEECVAKKSEPGCLNEEECSLTVDDVPCEDGSVWITLGGGANFPYFPFIGSVLQDIVKDHLQFTDEIIQQAEASMKYVETKVKLKKINKNIKYHFVGVHVRSYPISKFPPLLYSILGNRFKYDMTPFYQCRINFLDFDFDFKYSVYPGWPKTFSKKFRVLVPK